MGHKVLQMNENDLSFSSLAVPDKKGTALPSPTYLRPPKRGLRVGGSGYAQAGLKLFQCPRSPCVKINFFTRSERAVL